MERLLTICIWAIRVAGVLVPHPLRRQWIEDWVAEIRHVPMYLAGRGEPPPIIRRKLVSFSTGAFADAADLRFHRLDFRSLLGHPILSLAAPLACLAFLLLATHGLQNCRLAARGFPGYRPEELALLSRSARVLGIEAVPTAAHYTEWLKREPGIPMAGFTIDRSILRVTPGFFAVLGSGPHAPFVFLGHTIREVELLARPPARVGILARLKTRREAASLIGISAPNASAIGTRFIQGRMREPLLFATLLLLLVPGIGMLLVLRRPGLVRFFVLKTVLWEAVVAAAWAEFETGVPISLTGSYTTVTAFFLPGLLLALSSLLLWAALRDHQNRCPVCRHLLAMPVRIGWRGSLIFDQPGEEVLCPRGHGALLTSQRAFDTTEPAAWVAFDESWKDCFAEGVSK